MEQQNWLRYQDSKIAFACFTRTSGNLVNVLVNDVSTYISGNKSEEEARRIWHTLRSKGWHQMTADELSETQITFKRLWHLVWDYPTNLEKNNAEIHSTLLSVRSS